MKDRVTVILGKADKPMDFEKIYAALTGDGHPMPKDKPKLVLRKVLQNKDLFDVQKGGLFALKAGVTSD